MNPNLNPNFYNKNYATDSNNVIGMNIPKKVQVNVQQNQPQFQQFQNQVYQNQVNHINQQQNNQNVNSNQQLQEQQKQIQQLNPKYQCSVVKKVLNLQYQFEECDEYLCNIYAGLSIRIVLNQNFPKSPPKIYTSRKMFHKYFNIENWEIIYSSFYIWDQKKSNLLELINSLTNQFSIEKPKEDQLRQENDNLKNSINEDELYKGLIASNIQKIFPHVPPDALNGLINEPTYKQYINQLEEYKTMKKFIDKVSNTCENQIDVIGEGISNLSQRKEKLSQLEEELQQKKQLYLKLSQEKEFINERFSSNSIIGLMEQVIQDLDEKRIDNKQQDQNQEIQQYFQRRKNMYTLQIKLDKYIEQLD